MRRHRVLRVLKVLVIVLVAVTAFSFGVMWLWNQLMPAIFGLHAITFWQALGILVLSRILVGGFSRPRVVHKWEQLTPDEREKFRAAMQKRNCGEPGTAPA